MLVVLPLMVDFLSVEIESDASAVLRHEPMLERDARHEPSGRKRTNAEVQTCKTAEVRGRLTARAVSIDQICTMPTSFAMELVTP